MTQPPANWYPDPQQPAQLRYWDGVQWTSHVAPGQTPAPAYGSPAASSTAPTPKQRMSGGAIAAIVVGCVAGGLIILGILAAIAIPVFLNQREKADAAGTRASAMNAAIALEDYYADFPGVDPIVAATADGVSVSTPDGQVAQTATFDDGVTLGGFITYNSGEWCVWVKKDLSRSHYDSFDGFADGECS